MTCDIVRAPPQSGKAHHIVQAPTFHYLNWVKARYPATRINLSSSGMTPPSESLVRLFSAGRKLDIADAKGYEPLFERIAKHLGCDPGRVIAVPGCTYAMHVAVRSCVGPGETAAVETPTYELLPLILEAHGARAVRFDRRPGQGFEPDLDAIVRAVKKGARAVLLTSPHNPSGRLLAPATVQALADLARTHDVKIVVDEVYLDFHPRSARSYPSLAAVSDRFVVAGSLTKAHGLSGLRLGWIAGPPDVVAEAWRWQEILADRVPALDAQAGCVAFDRMDVLQLRAAAAYRDGFPKVAAWARGAGLELVDPRAGITALVKLPDGVEGAGLAEQLFEQHKVLVPPGEMFGLPGWLRISFAVPDDALREGLGLVAAAIKAAAARPRATPPPPPPRSPEPPAPKSGPARPRPRTRAAPARPRRATARASRGKGRTRS
jgi:aspartate/methionine/tyrosine aminotransferase